jgi:carboxymethylenebutenolidase
VRALSLLCLVVLCGCSAQSGKSPSPEASSEEVSYPSGKETVRGFLCRPAGKGPFPAVVVVHGDLGQTKWVKDQARRLAGRGYVALAVDLYRGEKLPEGVMDAHILDRALPEERIQGDLKAAVDYLLGRPDVVADRAGIIGWDSGGGYALDAARADSRLRAVVVCYGRLVTDAQLLAPLRASVLGIFAGKDEGISPQTVEQFRTAMVKAGKRVAGLHTYEGCCHGFMDSSDPTGAGPGAAAAAAKAWKVIESYLTEELQLVRWLGG